MSKADRTRQSIVEKTALLFNMKGFSGTSITDMMEATGLTKGSIYGNFASKDEVALAVFDYNFQTVSNYIKTRVEAKLTSIEKLLVYVETYRNFQKLPFLAAGCPILNTGTESDDTHPLLRERVINALTSWKTTIERHIKTGIERKEMKPSINIPEFSLVFISLVEGGVFQTKVTGKMAPLNASLDMLERLILDLKA